MAGTRHWGQRARNAVVRRTTASVITNSPGRRRRVAIAAAVTSILVLPVAPVPSSLRSVAVALPAFTRASLASDESQANSGSGQGVLSFDGRFVAFRSDATNLVAGDANGVGDIFLRDMVAGTTTRLSVSSSGTEANGDSTVPVISTDGRYVAFTSSATNLVSGDRNRVDDVFVRDTVANTTTRVSVSSSGGEANATSQLSDLSANGRYVVFRSEADNLGSTESRFYVRDVVAGTTTPFTFGNNGVTPNQPAANVKISDDGRFFSFSSLASNLGFPDTDNKEDVFLRDNHAKVTTLVSTAHTGGAVNQISSDGRYVHYRCNPCSGDSTLARWDRLTGASQNANMSALGPDATPMSGPYVDDTGRLATVAVGDCVPLQLCSPNSGYRYDFATSEWYQVADFGFTPALSPDGLHASVSTNIALEPSDTNGVTDTYVGDLPPPTGAPIGGPLAAAETYGGASPSERCTPCVTRHRADPISSATGNFTHTWTDLFVPGRGFPLRLTHTYNSGAAGIDGPLGFGWTHSYNVSLAVSGTTVTVTEEGGSRIAFTQSGGTYSAPPRVTATLVQNGDGTFTLTRRGKQILKFNAAGQLIEHRDLNGYVTTIARPSATSMVVTDPAGRALSFTLSGGRITSVSDASSPPRTVAFSYDASGNLVDYTDIGGGNWHFTYDSGHRLLTMRDPRVNTVTNHYDDQGRVDWQDDQLGRRTTFDYVSPSVTKVTDPRGNATLYTYAYGILVSEIRGYGGAQELKWEYQYDPATLGVTKVTDPAGRSTTMTYDSQGNRLSALDPLNRTTTWTYDGLNNVTSVTDAKNVTTTMTYDAAGNPLTRSRPLKDASGNTIATQTISYGYGGTTPVHAGDITSVTDPNGNVTQFRYDTFGNLVKTIEPPTPENSAGNTTTMTYDTAKGWMTSKVAPKGNLAGANPDEYRTTFEYDAYGRTTKVKDPLWSAANPTQHQRVFAYDANGNLTAATDGNNNTTTSTYDAANQLTSVARADGTTNTTAYDKAGNIVAQTDGAGFTTTLTHDAFNRVKATAAYQPVIRSDDPVAWWRLGEASGTTMADSSSNNRSGSYTTSGVSYGHEGAVPGDSNTAVAFESTSGYATVPDQDAFSPQVGATGAISVEAWIKLSALPPAGGENRAAIVAKSANSKFEYALYAYNNGNVGFQLWQLGGTSHSLAVGGSIPLNEWVHVVGTYKNGQATKVYLNGVEAGSSTTFTGSTGNGSGLVNVGRRHNGQNLAGSVDESAIYNVALTATRVSAHYDGGRGTRMTFDAVGNPTTMLDPAGQTTTYTYDDVNQMKGIDYSSPATPDVTNITYDAVGQRTGWTDGTGTSTWTWDSLNRLTSSRDGAANTVSYGYDLEDQLTSIVYPGSQAVTRHFDAAGRMDWVEDWNGNRTAFAYDPNSNLTNTTFPAATGVIDSYTFNRADELMGINVARGIVPLASFSYGRDGNDQVSSVTSTGVPLDNHAYTYTPLNQVKNVDAGAYGYDAADNPTQLPTGGRQGFNRLNQICWSTTTAPMGSPTCVAPPTGATTYAYDSRGNRTSVTPSSGPTTNMAYDQANRLTSYGTTATYTYNGGGLRTSKTVSGVSTSFAWDLASALPSVIKAGSMRYVYGPFGLPVAQIDAAGTTTYYHHDQLGSTRLLTDATGSVTGAFTYDTYGKLTASSGSGTTPFGFAGQYTDAESGFQYLRARYYDPATAQFLTVDPAFHLTRARYGYAGGNPLNAMDPTGLDDCGTDWNIGGLMDCALNPTEATNPVEDAWDSAYGAVSGVGSAFRDVCPTIADVAGEVAKWAGRVQMVSGALGLAFSAVGNAPLATASFAISGVATWVSFGASGVQLAAGVVGGDGDNIVSGGTSFVLGAVGVATWGSVAQLGHTAIAAGVGVFQGAINELMSQVMP